MENTAARDGSDATVIRGGGMSEALHISGIYEAECLTPRTNTLAKYMAARAAFFNLRDRVYETGRRLPTPDELDELLRLENLLRHDIGITKWQDTAHNIVTDIGVRGLLDAISTAYTPIVGPFLGLVSGASPTFAAGDTMASHGGWLEAGTTNAPQWTTPALGARSATSWAAASGRAKALSSNAAFSISTSGTVSGCFIVHQSGAVATALNISGTLLSAGAFTGGNKTVANLDTLNVSYSITLT